MAFIFRMAARSKPLTYVWTIDSLIDLRACRGDLGEERIFDTVDHVEAPDRLTVVIHMKRPDAGLLFNMSDGLFGVVPRGARSDLGCIR